MKINRLIRSLGISSLALLFGVVCAVPGVQAAPETILRIAGTMPIGHFMTRTKERFAQIVQEKTGGRIKIEVYPANQLFSDKDMAKALPAGSVEMGQVNLAMLAGLVPALGIMEIPYFFKDRDHMYRTEASPKFMQILDQELESKNLKMIFWMDYGMMSFIGKKPLRKLEDFKGKRIRGYSEISTQLIIALGGAPVFLSVSEVYLALQRQTIDGTLTSTCSVFERKFYEVTKYLTYCKIEEVPLVPAVLINLKIWNSLPPDVKKIMSDVANENQTWGFKEALKETDECLSEVKKRGMEIYYLPDKEKQRWVEATKPLLGKYLERTGKAGKDLVEEANRLR